MSLFTPRLTILIPFYNEENSIIKTLESLANQKDLSGHSVDHSLYQCLLVNNNSTDNSLANIEKFQAKYPDLRITVIEEKVQSHIAARETGSKYFIRNVNGIRTEYLGSADADAVIHPNWVDSVLRTFSHSTADVLSYAGTYPLEFYKRVPNLVDRYKNEIGSIFFDPPTIEYFQLRGISATFTEQIFFDFIRPPTDTCFAIRSEAFELGGGFYREFIDEDPQQEVYGEGWRMLFNIEILGARTKYMNDAPYNSSPRRLLKEPEKFLGFNSYKPGQMTVLRGEHDSDYDYLNNLALTIDLTPVKRYCIEYYILLRCIVRPCLIYRNSVYFGRLKDEIFNRIKEWRRKYIYPKSYEIYNFAAELNNDYFDQLLLSIPKQIIR